MNKYVVLLRGVNVGRSRKVPKADFQKVLESLGFSNVIIYINSGNAVFSSIKKPNVKDIQSALESYFKFTISTLLLSDKQVIDIANAIPDDWTNDALNPEKSGQKSDVLYLFELVNNPSIIEKIGFNPEIEAVKYIDGALITMISRKNQAKGSLQKLVSNKLVYNNVTIRNTNTARKLAELLL